MPKGPQGQTTIRLQQAAFLAAAAIVLIGPVLGILLPPGFQILRQIWVWATMGAIAAVVVFFIITLGGNRNA